MVLKIPKQAVETKKKRRIGSTIHCDYLKVSKEEGEGTDACMRVYSTKRVLPSLLKWALHGLEKLLNMAYLFPLQCLGIL